MSASAGTNVATSFYKTENIDMSDPALAAAWKDLTNDKSETNWLIFGFKPQTEVLEVIEVGKTGMKGLKTKLKSIVGRILFGAFAVDALDKRGSLVSKRPKFIAYSYVGSGCSELQRANSGFQKNKVYQMFNSAHLTIDMNAGTDVDLMLEEKWLGKKLHLSTAAHKPTHYNFGDSKDWSWEEIEGKEESDDEFSD